MATHRDLLEANRSYAESFQLAHLPMPPSRKLVVITCMDARMMVDQFLGLKPGEAHILRNAGGLVTDDVLRSLIISSRRQGTRTFYVVGHTDCGMLTFTDDSMRKQLQEETGHSASHLSFHSFLEMDANLRVQLRRILENPFLPRDIETRGFVYDVRTGRLREVPAIESAAQVRT